MDRIRLAEMNEALKDCKEVLKDEKGLVFEEVFANYIGFKIKKPGVVLVIYPYKTPGTGNIGPRVRDENSKNKSEYRRLQTLLYEHGHDMRFWERMK